MDISTLMTNLSRGSSEERLQVLSDVYHWLWTATDERVDDWPLMSSLWPISSLLFLYFGLTFVGPRVMRNRKPWHLKGVMVTYDIFIALFNLHIVIQFIIGVSQLDSNWFCGATDGKVTSSEEMRVISAVHLFFLSKVIEWIDTVFIVVRKKSKQLTFLHVYHHSNIVIIIWVVARFFPAGSTFFPMTLNAVVHVIMYSYYALTALAPHTDRGLWWKRYITIAQMVQFCLSVLNSINAAVNSCGQTRWIQCFTAVYMASFLMLFAMFYKQNYSPQQKLGYKSVGNGVGKVANGRHSTQIGRLM